MLLNLCASFEILLDYLSYLPYLRAFSYFYVYLYILILMKHIFPKLKSKFGLTSFVLFAIAVFIVLIQSSKWENAFLCNIICCFALAVNALVLGVVLWSVRIGLKTIGLTILASMVVAFIVTITLGFWPILFLPFVLLIILLHSKIQD